MSVTPVDVRHVARLARLGLDDARIPSLVDELNGILAHMDVLQQVDVSGAQDGVTVAPAPLRDDNNAADPLRRAREAFAPAMRDGFFLVPRLSTHGALGASASEDA